MAADVCNPKTEADWAAARLYATRRHLRDYREAHYDEAYRCFARGDMTGWGRETAKAFKLEYQIADVCGQLEAFGVW